MNLIELQAESQRIEDLILEEENEERTQELFEELLGLEEATAEKIDAWVRRVKTIEANAVAAKEMAALYTNRSRILLSLADRAKAYLRAKYSRGLLPAKLIGQLHSISFQKPQLKLEVLVEDKDELQAMLIEFGKDHPELVKVEYTLDKKQCKTNKFIPYFCEMVDGEIPVRLT